MTRETKIGLLVGLAFIIVIGILLSDHFRNTMEPPAAALTGAASSVRQAVNAPGANLPPVSFVPPTDVQPKAPVVTHDEMTPPVSPVTLHTPGAPAQPAAPVSPAPAPSNTTKTSDATELADAARTQGEPLVPIGQDNMTTPPADPSSPNAPAPQPQPVKPTTPAIPVGMTKYVAQPGDTVSKLAGRFLGGNNKANRQAIIDANASLKKDPNKIIVGQSYLIPAATAPTTPAAPATPAAAPAPTPTKVAATDSTPAGTIEYWYTVKTGDSLWKIATTELGNSAAVEALKELNKDTLKGDNHDVVRIGMKLRLPAKPIVSASAN